MKLTLPVPPSINSYWRVWHGRMVKTEQAKAYQRVIYNLALSKGLRPIKKPTEVVVRYTWFRKAARGDLDNIEKCIFDGLQGAAYDKDSQICEIHGYRVTGDDDPRVEIEVGVIRSMRR